MGGAQLQEITLPNARRRFGINLSMLLHEGDLPILNSDRHQVAIVAPVQKFMARWFLRVALEEREQVHTVEMNLEILAGERVALQHLRDQVGLASCAAKVGMKSSCARISLTISPSAWCQAGQCSGLSACRRARRPDRPSDRRGRWPCT